MSIKGLNSIIQNQKDFLFANDFDYKKRIEVLKKLSVLIKKYENELYEAFLLDLSKDEYQAFTSEIFPALDEISYFITHLKKLTKSIRVKNNFPNWFTSKNYYFKQAYGTCLLISPFNYPFQLLFVPLIGLIASGNSVIIKTSPLVKNINIVIKKIFDELNIPEIIFLIDNEKNVNEIKELFDINYESNFDLIFFTGSEKTGKSLLAKYSSKIIPIILELGGKSPVVIDETANIKDAVKKIIWGKFMNAGQTCIAPDYLLVESNVYLNVLDEFKSQINSLYNEEYIKSKKYGKLISIDSYQRLKKLIENQKVICGAKLYDNLLKISPTIIEVDNFEDNKIMQEEIFGPILPIIKINEKHKMIDVILKHPNPLAMYIFSNDKEFINNIFLKSKSGSFNINDVVIQITKNLPFGGFQNSGIGDYHKNFSFNSFTYNRVYTKATKASLNSRFNPYKMSFNYLKKVLLFFKKK